MNFRIELSLLLLFVSNLYSYDEIWTKDLVVLKRDLELNLPNGHAVVDGISGPSVYVGFEGSGIVRFDYERWCPENPSFFAIIMCRYIIGLMKKENWSSGSFLMKE